MVLEECSDQAHMGDGLPEVASNRALKRGEEGGAEPASWSASSFPGIPEWPGTQIKLLSLIHISEPTRPY